MKFDINTTEDIAVHEDWKAERGLNVYEGSVCPDAEAMDNDFIRFSISLWDGFRYGDGGFGYGRVDEPYWLRYGDGLGDRNGFGDGDGNEDIFGKGNRGHGDGDGYGNGCGVKDCFGFGHGESDGGGGEG